MKNPSRPTVRPTYIIENDDNMNYRHQAAQNLAQIRRLEADLAKWTTYADVAESLIDTIPSQERLNIRIEALHLATSTGEGGVGSLSLAQKFEDYLTREVDAPVSVPEVLSPIQKIDRALGEGAWHEQKKLDNQDVYDVFYFYPTRELNSPFRAELTGQQVQYLNTERAVFEIQAQWREQK